MTPTRRHPTDAELRAAFDRSGVAGLGINFETALADPAMRASLTCMANSDRRWAEHALGTGSRRLEHMARQTGHQPASGFIPLPSAEGSATPQAPGSVSVQNVPGGTIRTHTLRG